MFIFGSFRLDIASASLQRGRQAIVLTPKALNVLRYPVEHAGQLVTKDDLWRAVWPGISVTDATLTMCVSELRKALVTPPGPHATSKPSIDWGTGSSPRFLLNQLAS